MKTKMLTIPYSDDLLLSLKKTPEELLEEGKKMMVACKDCKYFKSLGGHWSEHLCTAPIDRPKEFFYLTGEMIDKPNYPHCREINSKQGCVYYKEKA